MAIPALASEPVADRHTHNRRRWFRVSHVALNLDPPISLSKWVDGCASPTVG
jgi:hypothetical protein